MNLLHHQVLRPPIESALPTSFIPVARITDMLLRPGEEFTYDGGTYTYPDIRFVYWSGGNLFHHHQNLNRLRGAWHVLIRWWSTNPSGRRRPSGRTLSSLPPPRWSATISAALLPIPFSLRCSRPSTLSAEPGMTTTSSAGLHSGSEQGRSSPKAGPLTSGCGISTRS